jgi:hypothetical protein
MTLLINIQINLLFKRKFPIGLTSKFGNLVWPNARAALVLSVSPMFYHGQLYRYTLDVYTWPFQFQNKSVPRKQTMNYRKVTTSVGSFHNIFF